MTTEIILNLPDEVYKKAEHFAQLTNRAVVDILTQAIALSLSPVSSQSTQIDSKETPSIASLLNEDVIALTELQMQPEQDKRLSELLYNQQAGTLTHAEHSELPALMQVYQEKLLLKAQALREAVQRGLREPLDA